MASRLLLAVALAALSLTTEAREVPQRPDVKPTPLQPYRAIPESAPRTKSCFVKPSCTPGNDDSAKILAAFEECNNGGTVVLDKEYTICNPLDLRFLKNIDVALTGTVKFCEDIENFQALNFHFPFQSQTTWWLWGGEDINLYGLGTGTIDGQGQIWYDSYATNKTLNRPLLFVTDGWHGGSISGLKLRQSPQVCYFLTLPSCLPY